MKIVTVLRFNDRNYNPGEWEAWRQSSVIAHARSLEVLQEKYPDAEIIEKEDEG